MIEWFLTIILFLTIVLIAGAVSDLITAILRCLDEQDRA